ncbi:MAG: CapA family protein [Lachnospiraceae bacterium]
MVDKKNRKRYRTLRERRFWKSLKPYQRMMIRVRRLPALPWYSAIILFAACFLFFVGMSSIEPKAKEASEYYGIKPKLTLDFVGDVMLGRNIMLYGQKNGYEPFFENVSSYWEQSDLTFANLECAVLKDKESEYEKQEKEINLYGSYEGLETAVDAGLDVFGCANNHSWDYGSKATTELIEWFDTNNIPYSGIGINEEKAESSYRIIDQNGVRIAFVSITDSYYRDAAANVFTTMKKTQNLIVNEASNNADLTIVYMHWGYENGVKHNEEQERLGHQLIDAGADIVIGAHPHVLQDVELYRNGVIFYSLGNFIFDQGNTYSKDSVIVRYSLENDGSASFKLIPIRLEDGAPYVTSNTYYVNRINNKLTENLNEDEYYYGEDGYVVIETDNTITFGDYDEVIE